MSPPPGDFSSAENDVKAQVDASRRAKEKLNPPAINMKACASRTGKESLLCDVAFELRKRRRVEIKRKKCITW